jgi:hypothetical protein
MYHIKKLKYSNSATLALHKESRPLRKNPVRKYWVLLFYSNINTFKICGKPQITQKVAQMYHMLLNCITWVKM